MPELPTHLYLGRSNFAGPIIGGYVPFCFGPKTLAAGGTGTDEVWAGFIAPCDLRLQRISWTNRGAPAANIAVNFYKDASDFTVAGATALTTAAIDLDASTGANATGYAEIASGGATTLVAAARNISKGDRVFYAMTYDATGTATDFCVQFYFSIVGHVNANSAND